jgi:hypothetical protein
VPSLVSVLPIQRLEGQWKLSQNRSEADREGVREGLTTSPAATDRALGAPNPERLAFTRLVSRPRTHHACARIVTARVQRRNGGVSGVRALLELIARWWLFRDLIPSHAIKKQCTALCAAIVTYVFVQSAEQARLAASSVSRSVPGWASATEARRRLTCPRCSGGV